MLPGKLSLDRFAYNGRAALAKTDSLGLNASAAAEYANAKLLTTMEISISASRYADKLRDAQYWIGAPMPLSVTTLSNLRLSARLPG